MKNRKYSKKSLAFTEKDVPLHSIFNKGLRILKFKEMKGKRKRRHLIRKAFAESGKKPYLY
jgi:hypothetical protein